jgi:membrane-associated phospholipid phosphatase
VNREFEKERGAPYAILMPAFVAFFVVDVGWCLAGQWTIALRDIVLLCLIGVSPLIPLLLSRYRNDAKIRDACISVALFIVFSNVGGVLSYLVVSTDAPLVDSTLAAWDQALGFDWPNVYLWVQQHHIVSSVFTVAYGGIFPEIAIITCWLCFTRETQGLSELYSVIVIAFIATCVIAGLFPAAGASTFYASAVHADISMLSNFQPLRAGSLKTIDMFHVQGLFSFPSFHAVMAIALAYAMRKSRAFPAFAVFNGVVILSTPTCGGHYLVDVLAGAATVFASILASKTRTVANLRTWRLGTASAPQGTVDFPRVSPARHRVRSRESATGGGA